MRHARALLPLLALLALLPGCSRIRGVSTGRGSVLFRVGALSFELPEDWTARGDAARVAAESPDGTARAKVERVERPFATGADCLAQAGQALSGGPADLERARRHPTRLGDRDAVTLEADLRGWHGWAWAVCDGPQQYRISFLGASPIPPQAVLAQRALAASVRFDARR